MTEYTTWFLNVQNAIISVVCCVIYDDSFHISNITKYELCGNTRMNFDSLKL